MSAAAATTTRRWLRRADAAKTYGISVDTLDRLRHSGEIRAKKFGRGVLIEADSLDEWVERLDDA